MHTQTLSRVLQVIVVCLLVYTQALSRVLQVIVVCLLVYTQALSRVLQVVVGPMLHFLQEEISRNKRRCAQLLEEKEELHRVLRSLPSPTRTDTLNHTNTNS